MLRDGIEHYLAYHLVRLLCGERTAALEWKHLGLLIEVAPDCDGGPTIVNLARSLTVQMFSKG